MALNKTFTILCDWFSDNKLSINFGKDKTESICLATRIKLRIKNY